MLDKCKAFQLWNTGWVIKKPFEKIIPPYLPLHITFLLCNIQGHSFHFPTMADEKMIKIKIFTKFFFFFFKWLEYITQKRNYKKTTQAFGVILSLILIWTLWISPTFPRKGQKKKKDFCLARIIYTWCIWWDPLSPRLYFWINNKKRIAKLLFFLFLLRSITQKFGIFLF